MTGHSDAIATLRDRRKHERVELKFPVRLRAMADGEALATLGRIESRNAPLVEAGATDNISLGGIGISGDPAALAAPLKKHGMVGLEIDLPGSTVHCVGTVVWAKANKDGSYSAGIAFLGLDLDAFSRVEQAVALIFKGSSA